MFGMPTPTQFDLNFRLLGIPVRVSPWFWLISAMLGPKEPDEMFLWVPCVFLSILVHEMGHGLAARSFGYRAEIALYGMGGVCASESERQSFGQRLAVLFGGPGAQFVLLGVLMAVAVPWLGISWRGDLSLAKGLFGLAPSSIGDILGMMEVQSALAVRGTRQVEIYYYLFQINLLWPLLNLLPIFPLDGGQITHTIWSRLDPRHGARRTHILSMVTAGIMAAYALSRMSQSQDGNGLFTVVFFGSFAFLNYQLLQAYHQQYSQRGYDDQDWWKR